MKEKNIGVLKDIKSGEFRVVMTPSEAGELVSEGISVYVASGAGAKAGFDDEAYAAKGAVIKETNEEIWAGCDMIVKVKEIEPSEYDLIREGQIIFTCIHPAAHREEVDVLLEKKVTAITAEDSHRFGSPNCEAAGKAGAFMGLWAMMSNHGGIGKFANGVGPSDPVTALVCGAGTVGRAAIDTLWRLGARVTVADVMEEALDRVRQEYSGVSTMLSSEEALTEVLPSMDLVINSVRWPKDASDFMISREMVASMRRGSVICDISNDYGCIETFRETTHDDPIYTEEGVIHYCVNNIPGAIAGSTSVAYAKALLPHFLSILKNGLAEACVTDEETSGIQGRPWVPPERILGIEDRELDPAPPATLTRSENYYPEFSG